MPFIYCQADVAPLKSTTVVAGEMHPVILIKKTLLVFEINKQKRKTGKRKEA